MQSKSNKNVIAIIQARIGSTRLHGKVLMDIEGKPMLWHLINRLKYCKLINKIVIATGITSQNEPIVDFCHRYNIDSYRGSEEDVLDRYYKAAKEYFADVIVRITADCPLIDPEVSDKVIAAYLDNSKDYDGASNIINRTYPRGLDTEVFPFSLIEKIWKESDTDYYREHVTIYVYERNNLFKLYSIENSKDFSYLRWTVDEESDLKFVKEVYKRLYKEGKIFFMRDILNLLAKEPYLQEINRDVRQKALR